MEGGKTAWLAGATGLIGGSLLNELLSQKRYERVVALVRRSTGVQHSQLVERIVNFSALNSDELGTVHDVFCALGTTIKKAGSPARFREIDFEYPLKLARAAKRAGAQQFLLVSSVGANAQSSNFYLRVKGELEAALQQEGFASLQIFRPSILVGKRAESRPGEKFGIIAGKAIAPLMIGGLRRYRPIRASDVAKAMVAAAQESPEGVRVYEFDSIRKLANY
jgi:uncharacterized protein YbjT (DUF2867 family)